MRIQGEVVSYAPMNVFVRTASYTANLAGDGWSVQYSYRCGCGDIHKIHAIHVWPTGDHKIDVVEHVCPTTNKQNQIDLAPPV